MEATFTTRATPSPEPPSNIPVEQALLGAILISNTAYHHVSEFLQPEHFANAVHGRIFMAIGKLVDQGHEANPITLKGLFDQDGALAEIGGSEYLIRLAESAVTIVNAPFYAETIHDLYRRRQLIAIGQDLVADAFRADLERSALDIAGDFEAAIAEVGAGPGSAGGPTKLSAAALDSVTATEAIYKGENRLIGLETGLIDLDRKLGGWMNGFLEIIAGRPSMGKSSLAGGAAHYLARQGKPGVIFSLEETAAQQAQRIIADRSGVPADRQRRGDVDMVHMHALVDAATQLADLPLWIDDSPGLTVAAIRRRARRMKRELKIVYLMIDHLQLIRPDRRTGNQTEELREVTRSLKELAKELDLPVIALSQLSREVERRENKRPVLADLRLSGSIEEDADSVIFVYRPEYYLAQDEPVFGARETQDTFNDRYLRWKEKMEAAAGVAELIVAKRRGGPTGTVKCFWDAPLTRFDNYLGPERLPEERG